MCGIVAYLGNNNAYEIIIKGLQRLEYRGYDSAGVALHNEKNISVYKQKGKVKDLEDFVAKKDISGRILYLFHRLKHRFYCQSTMPTLTRIKNWCFS